MKAITTIIMAATIMTQNNIQAAQPNPINVLVWDERQPKQKQMYKNFLGNHIADHLKKNNRFSVRSVGLDDPNQGLSENILDNTDVLIWWGHVRQGEVSKETSYRIIDRIKSGKLNLIILHSAHFSNPFIYAMHERAKQDALAKLPPAEREKAKIQWIGQLKRKAPKPDAPLTPSASYEKAQDGSTIIKITRPNCCFPYYKAHGKPSKETTLLPNHPNAAGLPKEFTIPQTEMYGEPFHVPVPDEVIFEEKWEDGKFFRAGMIWKIGKAKLFYFRPGHENFNVFFQKEQLKIVENATIYLANKK